MIADRNGAGPARIRSAAGPSPASEGDSARVAGDGTPVVGYLRVSTIGQAEDGAGLDVQLDAITAEAAAHGWRLLEVFSDEGISGKEDLGVRVELAAALDAVQSGRAGGVVVYRLDRLARDLMLQEQVLAEFWRAGGDVWSCSKAEAQYVVRDDPGDPSRKLIRQVLGAVAEYERAMITLRMSSGRARKHAAGGYAFGAPPFGWRAEAGVLVPVPDEQKVIARIVKLRDSKQSPSVRAIAERLNAEGLVTRQGKPWRGEQVRRVLGRANG